MNPSKYLILGAGPTGLGAAWRLQELGYKNWELLEGSSYPGGLATSFVDEKGFTWDIGGHVQFSHYDYFDRVMAEIIPQENWLSHQRESWVWIKNRFVPYPFQNNIRYLPAEDLTRCLEGLEKVIHQPSQKANNFKEWILATFGSGIAETFLFPYNEKVWAHPLEMMNISWMGERVAVPDLKKIQENIALKRDDLSWGPNNAFRFPKYGGTGEIWRSCAKKLPANQLQFENKIRTIDLQNRKVIAENGSEKSYDALISTIPLRELIKLAGRQDLESVAEKGLLFSSSNIVGIGLQGKPKSELATKCWMYFPESNCPFYRVTVFSNYSPNNVPDITTQWSLMAEVSESAFKPVNSKTLVEDVIQGLINTRLINSHEEIISTWSYRTPYGYPVPGIHRQIALEQILPEFEKQNVFSRGRFGAWKYEVSNQDHSFMQGVEIVERLLHDRPEITFSEPDLANSKKHPFPFEKWQGK